MRVVTSGMIVAITIGVLSTFGAGMQEKSKIPRDDQRSADVQDETPKGLELVARTEKGTFTAGEPILLSVFARNNGNNALFIVDTYHPEWDTKFDVRNANGESVAPTQDGKRLMKTIAVFRQVRIEIHPGDEVQKDFAISKLFDMTPPGTYSITLKRSFCITGTDVFRIAVSNTVKVTVVG